MATSAEDSAHDRDPKYSRCPKIGELDPKSLKVEAEVIMDTTITVPLWSLVALLSVCLLFIMLYNRAEVRSQRQQYQGRQLRQEEAKKQ